ncbi:galactokinase [Pedobacter endophyticus]|uniref:Galactokinase n=1 Tax=Pedobacter endophyticus TaxID=2789740 RepID=A0A7S9PZ51_9SPHI|nr:galactokinase [Pedobacter endophyticus]QPH39575.1 galactokinase [Pedobacter endophyticus]
MNLQDLKSKFKALYNAEPLLVRSPGRINIIGEHTDYNDGFVMPAAIDKAIYVGISKRDDNEVHLFSASYQQSDVSSVTDLKKSENEWANYILGVADQIQKRGYKFGGFNFYIDGDVPLGAGLSSSAAVECATGYALDQLFGLNIEKMDIALIGQKAEQTFAGVNCGIMDQFASVFGKKDHATMLDCRSMEYSYIPLKLDGYKLVLLNTNVKHSLSDSAYNKRRASCEQGVAWVKEQYADVTSLRDVDMAMLDNCVKAKDKEVYTKCKFVIEEIERLQKAAEELKNGNLKALGKLMLETHEGLSADYEVSCAELDFLVDCVKPLDEVLGARMMGGGFGGCTINIIKEEKIPRLIEELTLKYEQQFGLKLGAYVVTTDDGTSVIS